MNQIKLLETIKDKLSNSEKILTISIDGRAGAGKTTLAKLIAENFSGAQIIHMDDLYRGWELTLGPTLTRELLSIFEQLRDGNEAAYSKFDWEQNKLGEVVKISSPKMLVLEGVGSGQSSISDYVDMKIWVEIDTQIGLERVLSRDGFEISSQMELFILEQERHFTDEETKERSDFHIAGN